MTAARHNLTVEQGATWKHALLLRDSSGQPIDLTGHTARMQLRAQVASPDVMLELTTANGRIAITPLEGRLDLVLSATETAALSDSAVYDLELVAPSGEVRRLIRGAVQLDREVTR